MYVVDRDGLDGLLARPTDVTVPVATGGAGRGAEASSGLFALANAASLARAETPGALAEAPLASWSALAPLAHVADDLRLDTHVDLFPAEHVRAAGRPARLTMPAPVLEAADESVPDAVIDLRPRRSVRGLVLGGVAVAAVGGLLAFVTPRLEGGAGGADERPLTSVARRAAVPVPARRVAVASAATPAPPPPRRPVALPSAANLPVAEPRWTPPTLPAGAMLEWRLPAHFAIGTAEPESFQDGELRALVATLLARCLPETIELVGHTCTMGGDGANKTIGKRRARAARKLLLGYGLPVPRARTLSAGSTRPETENETTEGRGRNRRVTITCQPQRRQSRGVE